MAAYGWIITKDNLGSIASISLPSRVGTIGPRDVNKTIQSALENGEGAEFKMLDDDGELYYEGRLLVSTGEYDGDELFYPLDDFGMPDAGCTVIQYKNKSGRFQAI